MLMNLKVFVLSMYLCFTFQAPVLYGGRVLVAVSAWLSKDCGSHSGAYIVRVVGLTVGHSL